PSPRNHGGSSASNAAIRTPRPSGRLAASRRGYLDQDRDRGGVVVGAAVDRALAGRGIEHAAGA
ncbi:MAG TPA: hypothetical protein VK922_13695, partial [Gemmatimonadaceae bacterium]|nr:hypothetical protein [Gemmatimonadaceae bacterium]